MFRVLFIVYSMWNLLLSAQRCSAGDLTVTFETVVSFNRLRNITRENTKSSITIIFKGNALGVGAVLGTKKEND